MSSPYMAAASPLVGHVTAMGLETSWAPSLHVIDPNEYLASTITGLPDTASDKLWCLSSNTSLLGLTVTSTPDGAWTLAS
ncbi:hypothetical protein EJB05_50751, partial [Eragrostis curvula]